VSRNVMRRRKFHMPQVRDVKNRPKARNFLKKIMYISGKRQTSTLDNLVAALKVFF